MVQMVSRRSFTVESRVRSQVSRCEICGAHIVLAEVSVQVHRYSPVSTFQLLLHTHLHLKATFIRRTSGRNLGL